MYIMKIRVRNYKSISDSDVINIDSRIMGFIGQNNAGKSAMLDALQCFFPSCRKAIERKDFHKGGKGTISILVWFGGLNDTYIADKLLDNNSEFDDEEYEKQITDIKNRYKISNESMCVRMDVRYADRITARYSVGESSETTISEAELKKILPVLKVVPAIRDPKNESTAGSNSYLKELIAMLDDDMETEISISGSNVTYKQLNKILADQSARRCNDISREITEYYREAVGENGYEIRISSDVNISKGTTYNTCIYDDESKMENDILSCGTGYQSMVILSILQTYVKYVSENSEYILIIEEPEVYLHPSLQRKMIETLLEISEKNQILFSSHSPIVVGKVNRNQLLLVRRNNGESNFSEITVQDVIEELGVRADDILANKGIIFVEGKDDKSVIEHLLDKVHIGASDDINVLVAGNCTNLKFYANAELLINNRFDIPFLIIRDSDGMKSENRKNELLDQIEKTARELSDDDKRRLDKSIFIVSPYSLEGYFINEKLLNGIIETDDSTEDAIECFICQYKYYQKDAEVRCKYKNLANWYQPKHFLENFDDKFKATEKSKKEKHVDRYKEKWRGFTKCSECKEGKLDNFFKQRVRVNEAISDIKRMRENYMIKCLEDIHVSELKETGMAELIERLEEFCSEAYK